VAREEHLDLDLPDDADERCGGKFANVLEANLTDQRSVSAPLNALRLHGHCLPILAK
jgi:hypothetical protein